MERTLQIILIVGTLLFTIYILNMVRLRKIDLKYTLIWLLTCITFFFLAIFPQFIHFIAKLLSIKDPVNALFLAIIFFMLLILFSLTASASKQSKNIMTLTQELGLLKNRIENMSKQSISERKEG